MKIKKEVWITFTIVLLSFLIRVIRLDIPHDWSFDEVYHALSAEAYALNDPRGYEWWNQSPKDLAYEWLHPPLGKLFMAASIKLFAKPYIPESKQAPLDGATTFAWRFPGTVFAALTVWLLIVFGTRLFKSFWAGAVAGGLYALDGLSFVQSRTGMNDIYITFFTVLTFYCLYDFLVSYPRQKLRRLIFLGIASGLAASTKWTGFYAVAIAFVWGVIFLLKKRDWVNVYLGGLILGLIPVIIYVSSYAQWWTQGHTLRQFYELHQQIWWYQTGLKATHDYQSPALSWPILYRPVWFYVKYEDVPRSDGGKEMYIGNIYTMGNPLVWWAGLAGVIFGVWKTVELFLTRFLNREKLSLGLVLIAYFGMFVPWALSPRIMFLYHYLPSVPFLCLMLSYVLLYLRRQGDYARMGTDAFLIAVVFMFIFFYPHWTAVLLPQSLNNIYYWFPAWK